MLGGENIPLNESGETGFGSFPQRKVMPLRTCLQRHFSQSMVQHVYVQEQHRSAYRVTPSQSIKITVSIKKSGNVNKAKEVTEAIEQARIDLKVYQALQNGERVTAP
jgi:hypothetical protein